MLLNPRYDGPALIEIEGVPDDALAPLVRQRRRLSAILAGLDADQWAAPSRCEGWSVGDVVAHLIGTDGFWRASVLAGLGGTPTTILERFDPAATPPQMIAGMRSLSPAALLDQLTAAQDGLLGAVAELDTAGWSATAEAPPGHVPVRIMCIHALWDCWIHERDIVVPLGLSPTVEADEVGLCLRYAAAISPAFGITMDPAEPASFTVDAWDPDVSFVLDVGDRVVVRSGEPPTGAHGLQGGAVELTEALTLRVPVPASTPEPWRRLLRGLAAAFDTEVELSPTP